MVENGQKWLTIQICHILNAQEAKKTLVQTCEKGPKLRFEYLPTSKTSHCAWHSPCWMLSHLVGWHEPSAIGRELLVPLHRNMHYGLLSMADNGGPTPTRAS